MGFELPKDADFSLSYSETTNLVRGLQVAPGSLVPLIPGGLKASLYMSALHCAFGWQEDLLPSPGF